MGPTVCRRGAPASALALRGIPAAEPVDVLRRLRLGEVGWQLLAGLLGEGVEVALLALGHRVVAADPVGRVLLEGGVTDRLGGADGLDAVGDVVVVAHGSNIRAVHATRTPGGADPWLPAPLRPSSGHRRPARPSVDGPPA